MALKFENLISQIFDILPYQTRIVGEFMPTVRGDNTYRCIQVLFPGEGSDPAGKLKVIGIHFENEIPTKYEVNYTPDLISVLFDNSRIDVPVIGEFDGYPIIRLPTGEAATYSIMTECFIQRPYLWK